MHHHEINLTRDHILNPSSSMDVAKVIHANSLLWNPMKGCLEILPSRQKERETTYGGSNSPKRPRRYQGNDK
ncbi:hypothetical protein M0802_002883 [Mischocyttarus mexicanus]|nr:hypothetical protein M0802_002883 [Mischocyttarus mexicanus]